MKHTLTTRQKALVEQSWDSFVRALKTPLPRGGAGSPDEDGQDSTAPPGRVTRPTAMAGHRRGLIAVRAAYAAIAVAALWLVVPGIKPGPDLTSAQMTCASALLVFAAAAAAGLWRLALVRHSCVLTGLCLMLTPLFLPGPFSLAVLWGGLGAFVTSAWMVECSGIQKWCPAACKPAAKLKVMWTFLTERNWSWIQLSSQQRLPRSDH